MLVLVFKLFDLERRRKIISALGAVAVLFWSLAWLFWPKLSFSELDPSLDFFAWWFATSIFPLFIYLVVLAVGKRLVLDMDQEAEPED